MGNLLKGLAEMLSNGNSISDLIANSDNLASLSAGEINGLDFLSSNEPE